MQRMQNAVTDALQAESLDHAAYVHALVACNLPESMHLCIDCMLQAKLVC